MASSDSVGGPLSGLNARVLALMTEPSPGFQRRDFKRDLASVLLIAVLGLILYGIGNGRYGFIEPDEAKLPVAAREMKRTLHILTPEVLGQPDAGVPIPAAVAAAAVTGVLGNGEGAFRWASALAGVCGLVFFYAALSRLVNRTVGVAAALALGAFPMYYGLARFAGGEIMTAAAMAGLAGALALALEGKLPRKAALIAIPAFTLLVFALSGPQGIMMLVLGLGFTALYRTGRRKDAGGCAPGTVRTVVRCAGVAAALCAAYAVLLLVVNGAEFLSGFTGPAWFSARFAAEEDMAERIEYYLRGIIFGLYPWSCLLPFAFLGLAGRNGSRAGTGDASEEDHPAGAGIFFALLLAAGFITLTLQSSRNYPEFAPLLPAVAGILVLGWKRIQETWGVRTFRLCLLLSIMLGMLPRKDLKFFGLSYFVGTFAGWVTVPEDAVFGRRFVVLSTICLAGLALVIVFARIREAWIVPVVLGYGLACYASWVVIPEVGRGNTARTIVGRYAELSTTEPLYVVGSVTAGISFYSGGKTVAIPGRIDPLTDDMAKGKRIFCLVARDQYSTFERQLRAVSPGTTLAVLATDEELWLVSNR